MADHPCAIDIVNAMKRVIVDLLLFRNCSVPELKKNEQVKMCTRCKDGTKREPVFSKPQGSDKGAEHLELLQHAREEREHREKDNKQCLASKDGLRAGALVVERDNPVRWAMGPARHSALDNGRKEAPMTEDLQLRACFIIHLFNERRTHQRKDFATTHPFHHASILLFKGTMWCSRRWEEGRGVIGGLQRLVYVQVRVEPTAVRMGISKQGEGVRHD
ncbi:hypothetical protein EDD22DRAFT_986148 [Suillus occidentalis]|nr:hypothetical protein EDD22DRAFT_986148 [Suillus occidentalis]